MATPAEEILAGAGPVWDIPAGPTSPVLRARQSQAAEPPDPSEFFHVGPGMVPADHPEYKQDRDLWWQHFVSGFYQQNFRNVNDYIEYVGSLGDHPAINAFAKKQAEKFMPPKLKEELEQMKAEKKQKKAFDDAFETVQRLNKDPRMRKLNQVAELDPKGGIKFTELKIDPELDRWKQQADQYQDIIKTTLASIERLKANEMSTYKDKEGNTKQFTGPTRSDVLVRGLEAQLPELFEKLNATHMQMMGVSSQKTGDQTQTPEQEQPPTMTPEQARALPPGTMFLGTDGRLRKR